MKKFVIRTLIIVLCVVLFLSYLLISAKDNGVLTEPKPFDKDHPVATADSFVAAENDQYQLKWEEETKRIVVYDKLHDITWSNTPVDLLEQQYDEYGYEVENLPKLETTLLVEYIETKNFTVTTSNAYLNSLKKNSYVLEKIDNGFKITYYYDKLEISVPVSYTLNDDGFSISVDPSEICENGNNLVNRLHIAPFMCSVPVIAEDSYLFHPSGSGALIYADKKYDVGIPYSYSIYGDDSLYIPTKNNYTSNTETVKLPVFGAKNGNRAIMGVISEGAELANIWTDIGDSNFGYSAIYPVFDIRGRQTTKKAINNSTQYSDQYTSAPIKIDFYPLYDDEADYVGMANKYREYLIEERGMQDLEEKTSVSISLVGGTIVPHSVLGVPTTKLLATTTVTDAGKVLKDISENVDVNIVADLFGYGESGVDIGEPGGGLGIGKSIGTEEQLKALANQCKEDGIDLFFNYDLMTFNENGSGLTTTRGGSAKDPSHTYSRKSDYYLGHGTAKTSVYSYFHISRLNFVDFAKKAISYTDTLGVFGISSRNISSSYYADYSDNRYIAGGNMANDVRTVFNEAKNKGLGILSYSANDYAAAMSNYIIEAPIHSNFYDLFDEDVPFYQIVFKGYIPTYGTALNTVTDDNLALLRCVESGCGLRYSVINNYSVELLPSNYQIFASSLYSDIKDSMFATINSTADFYDAINDAKIVDHVIINDNVRKVVYDNDTVVYVNYGKTDYQTENGVVSAESYFYVKGAGENA